MYLQYKTLTKLTKEELKSVNRPKSEHTYGDDWMNWAIKIRDEVEQLDAENAEKMISKMQKYYQILEAELKRQQIRRFIGTLKNIARKESLSIKLSREGDTLFRWTGIIYVPYECERLTSDEFGPYMEKVSVLHLHSNIKYIDAKMLKKCPKLHEISWAFGRGNAFYEVWDNQLFDKRTNERLWP